MRCPGQDRRYWTEESVFEVPCPECGASVEFFKDESSGRCTKCGHRFRNPGIDFGCATWCSLAEQCLGFVPEGDSAPKSTEGALAGRLIQRIGEQFKNEPERMISALKAFHHAKELVAKEGGTPRIVLAASLLLEIAASPEGRSNAEQEGHLGAARQILRDAGADEATITAVTDVIGHYWTGGKLDAVEFKIVADAGRLARLTTDYSPDQHDEVEAVIHEQLVTDTAKQRARSWCRAVDGERD